MLLRNGCCVLLLLCTAMVVMVTGDTYMQIPRGSNNRLNEDTANRKTNNRMFDSQNNNKGGYNVGEKGKGKANKEQDQFRMKYFMSEEANPTYFPVEWTNQHGCGKNTAGDPNKLNCNMVLQFMCTPEDGTTEKADQLRDGTTTQRQGFGKSTRDPKSLKERDYIRRRNNDARTNKGLHEPFAAHDKCVARERNKGLFTADQNVKNNKGATATRQNPNGNRNGFECAEERDYYPYWHPTDWKDIAVLTEDESLCANFKAESFNSKAKHECRHQFRSERRGRNTPKYTDKDHHLSKYNNEAQCTENGGTWRAVESFLEKADLEEPACKAKGYKWGHALYGSGQEECLVPLPELDCKVAQYTRVNHLGNSATAEATETPTASQYMWKVPNFPSQKVQRCVFRIRYNISTTDYDPYNTDSKSNDKDEVIENNPKVDVGLDGGQELQLALNTAQTGRTFQDRSHVMEFHPRNDAVTGKDIHMLTVRGKRGNIVQTFPAVEYDFVPNTLKVNKDDLIHMEWTGSNTHDNNGNGNDGQAGDDGQGKGGTDRSNIMPMLGRGDNFFLPWEHSGNMFKQMQAVYSDVSKGPVNDKLDMAVQLASGGQFKSKNDFDKNEWQEELNNAPASFAGMVVKIQQEGTYNYGCTRNNNFSNRSQKGTIIVK